MLKNKTLKFKRIGERSYAKIINSEGVILWRTRSSNIYDTIQWECPGNQCVSIDEFIELADKFLEQERFKTGSNYPSGNNRNPVNTVKEAMEFVKSKVNLPKRK